MSAAQLRSLLNKYYYYKLFLSDTAVTVVHLDSGNNAISLANKENIAKTKVVVKALKFKTGLYVK